MNRPNAPSHRWRTGRRIFAGGVAVVLLVIWIGSYFYSFGVAYSRKGDFDRRITSRTRGVNCMYGTFVWYSQWADPPDPQDKWGAVILTINNQMMTLTNGFSAATGPADSSNPYHAFLGFSYYRGESNAPDDPYGTRFGIARLQFPIALVALPLCLLFVALLRRTLRRRSNAARGFAVMVGEPNSE
jgi:hypothetical protein